MDRHLEGGGSVPIEGISADPTLRDSAGLNVPACAVLSRGPVLSGRLFPPRSMILVVVAKRVGKQSLTVMFPRGSGQSA